MTNTSQPTEAAPTILSSQVDRLMRRMQAGDREAAAEFITRYGRYVRRRVRGKLPPNVRALFDSQEILSTVGRRLDLYVRQGKLDLVHQEELWSLVFRIADNATIEKARVFRRLRAIEGPDSVFARRFYDRLQRAERRRGAEAEIAEAMNDLEDASDRQILAEWLAGREHTETAAILGWNPERVRKRWERIKERLRHRGQEEVAR